MGAKELFMKALQAPGIYQCPRCGHEIEMLVRSRGTWCFRHDAREGIEMVRRHPSTRTAR